MAKASKSLVQKAVSKAKGKTTTAAADTTVGSTLWR